MNSQPSRPPAFLALVRFLTLLCLSVPIAHLVVRIVFGPSLTLWLIVGSVLHVIAVLVMCANAARAERALADSEAPLVNPVSTWAVNPTPSEL